jgi:hypothetical protein
MGEENAVRYSQFYLKVDGCFVGGHPAPAGRALTNDLCGQYFKINVNLFISALAKINYFKVERL